jgi:ABC-type antimicrobial peptide transport system permease subunit
MSATTSQLVIQAVAKEREIKRQIELMETTLKNDIGSINDKALAVAICGNLSKVEEQFLKRLSKKVSEHNLAIAGNPLYNHSSSDRLSKALSAIIVLGDGKKITSDFNSFITRTSSTTVIIDSKNARDYLGTIPHHIKKENFFGSISEEEKNRAIQKEKENRFRTLWIGIISILVTVISVSNALLMSVTERFKEIGTMKCLGALSSFIRQLFLIESAVIGITGSIIGTVLGAFFSIAVFAFSFSFAVVFGSLNYSLLLGYSLSAIVIGTVLSIIAAIYPANVAARMVPATALRTNV